MKRTLIALFSVATLAWLGVNPLYFERALADGGTTAKRSGPAIRLGAEKGRVDDLLQGQKRELELEVFNDGDSELAIDRVTPSCKCTEVISFPQSLAPGTSGRIVYTVNSKLIKAGDSRKELRIYSNDPIIPRAVYEFIAEVIKLYNSRPADIRLEGIVDQPKQAEVDLIAATDLGFELVDVKSRNGRFEIIKKEHFPKEQRYHLVLRAKPGTEVGVEQDPLDLTIKVKDGRIINVGQWVYIHHNDHISVKPDKSLRFLNRDTDRLLEDGAQPIAKVVLVTNGEPDTEYDITGVKFTGGAESVFTSEVRTLVAKKRYAVRVIISEYQKKAYVHGKMIIEFSDPRKPKHEINLQAMFGRRRRG